MRSSEALGLQSKPIGCKWKLETRWISKAARVGETGGTLEPTSPAQTTEPRLRKQLVASPDSTRLQGVRTFRRSGGRGRSPAGITVGSSAGNRSTAAGQWHTSRTAPGPGPDFHGWPPSMPRAAPAINDGNVATLERIDLSVVVVSWNSARFLDGCLTSLFAQRGVSVEVIVVDNGSTDGSLALIREKHPLARLIEMGSNLGFCAANNIGLAFAHGAFVLFANSDIILEVNFAEEALSAFDRDPRIGLVGGKLLRFDRRTVDSAGQFLTRSRKIVERGYGAPDGAHTAGEGYVFSICGAAMIWRAEALVDISVRGELFDQSYFAFSEDLDVGWRARLAGWRAWYAPRAVGYHYRGGTETWMARARPLLVLGGKSFLRPLPAILRRPRDLRYHIIKNRWLTLLKNDSVSAILRDLPFIAARDLGLVAAAAAVSPSLILDLLRSGAVWRGALSRRRAFLKQEGRWGKRTPGTHRAWVRWRAPLPSDPE